LKIICIIGSSGSIAKKIQLKLLKRKDIKIYGCSRAHFKLNKKNFLHTVVDACNAKEVNNWLKNIFSKEKKIDALICLSGTTRGGDLVINMNEDLEYEINFNNFLKSVIISNKEVLKYFIKNKSGSIINFSSISYKKNLQGSSVYSASKAAVSSFTKILAKENLKFNINANIIIPFLIENKDTKQRGKVWKDSILSLQDTPKVKVESLVNLINFLSDKENYYITGQEISIGSIS
jgi:3-oxoacyl-[acyl-carrier protein] reductase